MRSSLRALVVACMAAFVTEAAADASLPSLGERWRERFIDAGDGRFDASEFLASAHGFLPIPIIVTEPAVGYGGGLAALFLRPRREAAEGFARPDMSGIGAVATQNGTRVAFAGDSRHWLDGRVKTLAGAIAGDIRLDVYGLGTRDDLDEPVRYTLDIRGAGGHVEWKLAPGSPWSVAVRFLYAEVRPKLRDEPRFAGLDDRVRVTIAGPGVALIHDSRDNVFTPTRGVYAETAWFVADEAFGANRGFRRFGQTVIGYWPLASKVTLGARADYLHASDGAPFFVRPFIAMRGIPAMRYPGNDVASAEVELRWQLHGRWSVVAFGGAGHARLDESGLRHDRTAGAGGVGVRYELARRFGLHVGLDVARGPEETAVYLQVGSAWFKP